MKNKLLTFAGALALLAVVGKFYAAPALAQAVRAAVVKNIDEKGRIPYQQNASFSYLSGYTSGVVNFPPVPQGKRLVIERVNVALTINTPGLTPGRMQMAHNGPGTFYFSPQLDSIGGILNAPVLLYLDGGDTASLSVNLVGGTSSGADYFGATISGYLVDLNQ